MSKQPSFTIGIEEEYKLVDADTLDLLSTMPATLMEECRELLGNQVTKEFLQCQIEIGTAVCNTMQEAQEELIRCRRIVSSVAQRHNCLVMAASTHPFSMGTAQHTKEDRYERLAEELQFVVRRLFISGMHVHVGIDNDDESRIDLMNQVTYILPHLLALSTSSPFWKGENTGLKSYRIAVWDQMPRTGLPQIFDGYSDYLKHVNVLVNAGIIDDPTMVWWDIRPSFKFPTLEMRISDVCTNLQDAIAIAAGFRCWLRMLYRLKTKNQRWRTYSRFVIAENRWRARRYGTDESLIDFGKEELVDFKLLTDEFVDLVMEDAEHFDCVDELLHLRVIAQEGTSAHRQIEVYENSLASGNSNEEALRDVVRFLVKQSMAGVES